MHDSGIEVIQPIDDRLTVETHVPDTSSAVLIEAIGNEGGPGDRVVFDVVNHKAGGFKMGTITREVRQVGTLDLIRGFSVRGNTSSS